MIPHPRRARPPAFTRWARAALPALAAALLCARPLPAQTCAPSYRDLADAIYAQVLQRGGDAGGLGTFQAQLGAGTTVRQIVSTMAHSAEFRDRFITPLGSDHNAVVTLLYRTLLAREPDAGAWGWAGVGAGSGWDAVITQLIAGGEYAARFGDHAVPGSPVTAWDCARATLTTPAGHDVYHGSAMPGAVTAAYSTPAYVSLDQERSVTLLYSSGLARPMGFLQMDVVDNTVPAPAHVSIRIRHGGNGAWLTFANGVQENFFQAGPGATRVSALFDAGTLLPRSWGFDVVVRKWNADGTLREEKVITQRINILNEKSSSLGAGWTVAGVPVLYDQGDGVYVVDSGTGTWWDRVCDGGSCRYVSDLGEETTLTWTGSGGERRYPDGAVVAFGADGRAAYVEDRHGNRVTYGWTGGRLTSVTDPVGKQTTLAYDAANRLATITDPMGRVSRVTVNAAGDLVSIADPTSTVVFTATYDALHRMRTSTRHGVRTAHVYDAASTLTADTLPEVTVTSSAGATSLVRPVVRYRSPQFAVLPAAGTGTSLATAAARVDPAAVRTYVTDPLGNTTRAAVNLRGQATRIEHPLGRVTTRTWSGSGRLMRTVSHGGGVVRRAWNGRHLVEELDETTFARTTWEYGPFDQVTRVAGTGPEERYQYFMTGTRTDSVHATVAGRTTRSRRDARGRDTVSIDPEGHATRYTYGDAWVGLTLGNLETVSAGSSSQRMTTLAYDAYGRRTSVTDPMDRTSVTVYDLLNRVTHSWSQAQDTVWYAYTPAGELWTVTDARRQVYEFERNALGWVTAEKDPRGLRVLHGYDAAGNPTQRTDRRGKVVRTTFDALGRRVIVEDVSTGTQNRYNYGPQNQWIAAWNGEASDTVYLDPAGRPLQHVTRMAGRRYALSSSYDARGVRTGVAMTAPWTRSIGFRYNAALQLDTLIDLAGGRTQLVYDADGMMYQRNLPVPTLVERRGIPSTHMDAQVQYHHNFTYANPLNDALGLHYTQDELGRTATRWSNDMEHSRAYAYDTRGRLQGWEDRELVHGIGCSYTPLWDVDTGVKLGAPNGSNCDGDELVQTAADGHSFDRVGNRTDRSAVVSTGNRLDAYDGYTLSYDADGNLVRKLRGSGASTYDQVLWWNGRGQLDSVWTWQNGAATKKRYGYDAFGRRVRVTTAGVGDARYLYDGENLFMELDGAGNAVREWTFYPGVDQPHSLRQGGQTYYYLTEQPGHVAALINGQGQVVSRYRYDPWGKAESVQDPLGNPLRFTAREYDAETGLYYHRARWYDPSLGRFISEDPIGLEGGINPYVYAENNPVGLTDPYGLEPACPSCIPMERIHVEVRTCSDPVNMVRGSDGVCRVRERSSRGGFGGQAGNIVIGALLGPLAGPLDGPRGGAAGNTGNAARARFMKGLNVAGCLAGLGTITVTGASVRRKRERVYLMEERMWDAVSRYRNASPSDSGWGDVQRDYHQSIEDYETDLADLNETYWLHFLGGVATIPPCVGAVRGKL